MIGLQKRKGLTKYLQLRDIIYSKIESDEYSVGALIPSESELMERYKVSKATVRQALSELENEGVLRREQGRGTYVESLSKQARKITVTVPQKYDIVEPNTSIYKFLMGVMAECHELGVEMTALPLSSYVGSRVPTESNFIWPWPEDNQLDLVRKAAANNKVVIINRVIENEPDIVYFSIDHFAAARQGMEKLIERGHRKLGFIHYPNNADIHLRHQGYLHAMKEAGLEVKSEYVLPWSLDKDNSQFERLLSSGVTAILSAQGLLMPFLMAALDDRRIKVSDDIEVMTFNRIPDDATYKKYVHEIVVPYRKMAHLAVRYCIEDSGGGNQLLKTDLVMKD